MTVSRAPLPGPGTASSIDADAVVGGPVSTRDVLLLQSLRHFPSVSVLMSTTPGLRMTVTDAAGSGDLLDQAELRLRRIDQVPDPTGLIEELQRLGRTVSAEPTDRAAAVYDSQHTSRAVRLGVPVVDRVVIDTTFATRDLVLTLQRTPTPCRAGPQLPAGAAVRVRQRRPAAGSNPHVPAAVPPGPPLRSEPAWSGPRRHRYVSCGPWRRRCGPTGRCTPVRWCWLAPPPSLNRPGSPGVC
jgi:hypothetical protein